MQFILISQTMKLKIMRLIVQLRNFKTGILAIWKHIIFKNQLLKNIYLDYKNSYISDKPNIIFDVINFLLHIKHYWHIKNIY